MNKTYIYVVVAVVVLALVGAAYAFKSQIKSAVMPKTAALVETTTVPVAVPTASPTGAVAASVEVDYTATGFSPASVTVKKGETVKFVNKTTSPMSVASNPHPTHTDYPGFDQFKSSQKGQAEYDFVFDKVGTWGYHNHAKPGDTGTVVVTE